MSELPEGWAEVALGDVIQGFEAGRNLRSSGHPANPNECGVLKISAVTWGSFRPDENKALLPGDEPRSHERVRKGDLLISRANTSDLVGAVVLVEDDHPRLMLPDKILRIVPTGGAVEPRFLVHALRSDSVRTHFSLNATGTSDSMRNLSQPKMTAAPFRLPPLKEQRRIVERVEALLADVNATRERLAKVPSILKRFRQSVLSAACSGRLTEEWRQTKGPGEHALKLIERIAVKQNQLRKRPMPQNRKAEESGTEFSPEIDIPETWAWCRLEQIADIRLGGTPSRKDTAYWGGTIPWVSSGEVANCRIAATREQITDAGLENSNAKLYPKGTVLIAMIGEGKTRGQAAILDIEACTNQNAAGLIFDAGNINPEYVWRWALGEYEKNRNVGRGGNQPALNGQKVRDLWMPLAPLAEQDQIVQRIDALFALADAIEARVARATACADKLTKSILAKAFCGELVLTEAELARREGREYEPASVLLEKFRADHERAASKKTAKRAAY